MNKAADARDLLLVSGYYGFGNLGDEAILEEIIDELKKLVPAEKIVVLSNNPDQTERTFGVQAINRWKMVDLIALLPKTRLFISGGGGLFQDSVSVRSPIFYGTQIALARMYGAHPVIYAQGIGPLKTALGTMFTKQAFKLCEEITVRDQSSMDMLKRWRINAQLTADPVWCLDRKPLPSDFDVSPLRRRHQKHEEGPLLVGLSLRVTNKFSQKNISDLIEVLHQALPEQAKIVPLVLQLAQDFEVLDSFEQAWRALGREVIFLDTSAIKCPSQWITFLSMLDIVIAMRLHAAILTLRAGLPAVAIAYDPKVSHVAQQFQLPTLNLTKDGSPEGGVDLWVSTLKSAIADRNKLAIGLRDKTEAAGDLAGQNFRLLDRILGMQRDANSTR